MLLLRYGTVNPIRMRLCLTAHPAFPPQSRMAISLGLDAMAVLSVSEDAQYWRNAGLIRIDERPRACNDLKFDGSVILIPTTSTGRSVPCTARPPRIILYAVLRHLVVRPDSTPVHRPQLLLSFAYLENQSSKISAADYSHMVARAAPNRSNGFDLQPFRYARILVTVKVILWSLFQWSEESGSVATNFQSTQL